MFRKSGKETIADEEKRLKAEFKKAAKDESSDDFMVKKDKKTNGDDSEEIGGNSKQTKTKNTSLKGLNLQSD